MKHKTRFIRLIMLVLLTTHTIQVFAKQSVYSKYGADFKEFALQECLYVNYESLNINKSIGGFITKDLRDASFWRYRYAKDNEYSLVNLSKLYSFVREKTGSYYSFNFPVKAEETPKPVNTIFYDCMTFYHSKELNIFVHKLLK